MIKKYKVGQKLKALRDTSIFTRGQIYTITNSILYPSEYDFEEEEEVGWSIDFVENFNIFMPIKTIITNWESEFK